MEPTKLQNDEIILPVNNEFPKRCIGYNKEFDYLPKYIADMLRDIAEAKINSYPELKGNSSGLQFFIWVKSNVLIWEI